MPRSQFEGIQVSAQSLVSSSTGTKSDEQVMTEEEVNDSKVAVSNSVGDK